MQRWDLAAPNETQRDRPRVLFSTVEARAVVIDLAADEELGEHRVRERAILQVLDGMVECSSGGDAATCGRGTVVLFERPVAGAGALRRIRAGGSARVARERNRAAARRALLSAATL